MNVKNSKVLIVAMAETPGYDRLNVHDEITAIQRHIGSSATLQHITACSLVHFACHASSGLHFSKSALLLVKEGKVDMLTVDNL